MGEFLGIASHELRTPLTSITANVQMACRQLKALSQNTLDSDADTPKPYQLDAANTYSDLCYSWNVRIVSCCASTGW